MSKPINLLLQAFFEDTEFSPGTKSLYKKTIQYFITFGVKNNIDFSSITKADIIEYKSHLSRSGLSKATIDNYISSLRVFFRWAKDTDQLPRDPTDGIRWERDRSGTFIKMALSIKHIDLLLRQANAPGLIGQRNYALLSLMSYTGLRCIEVSRMDIGDLKHTAGNYLLQIQRKGSNEKSGSLLLREEVIASLYSYWQLRPDANDDSPAFANHSRRSCETRISTYTVSKIVKAALRSIGLDSRQYTAHSLRHTAATIAYQAGAEPWEIGRLLGHKNPRQTEHYIHSLGIETADQGKATDKIFQYIQSYRKQKRK